MASATKQALLAALSAAQGECISGQQLAQQLGVSRAAVHIPLPNDALLWMLCYYCHFQDNCEPLPLLSIEDVSCLLVYKAILLIISPGLFVDESLSI